MFDWFDPSALQWWGWLLAGAVIWFFINSFALPDAWSTWLAQRKNGLLALLPFAILALIAGGGLFLWGAGWAFLQAVGHFVAKLSEVKFAWWVGPALIGGLLFIILYVLTNRSQITNQLQRKVKGGAS